MKQKRFWIMLVVLIGSVLVTCCIGRFPLSLRDIWEICVGTMEEAIKRDVFLKIRLSRTFFVGMTGAALAIAGLVYQELFQNPLVSPDVLGVSSGACVGAVGAILLGGSALLIQTSAMVFGLLAVFLTIALSRLIGRQQAVNMILAGIVVKAVADAVIMAFKYLADPNRQLPSIDYWLMGSFHTVRWTEVLMVLPFFIISLLLLWLLRFKLQVMSLGEEEAKSLGIPVEGLRFFCILLATVLVASSVSVTGVISWVGLIVPHMVRFFTGHNLMKNFGICGCAGAILMIWTDTLARSLSAAEIPISILTSFIGAVFLFFVLIRRRRRGEAEV
ncbi:MAG: FecCD family ABC transporter permease [Lachnospiraceae bacterium]